MQRIRHSSIKSGDAYIICVAKNDLASLQAVDHWMSETIQFLVVCGKPITLCLTKDDLPDEQQQVSLQDLQ